MIPAAAPETRTRSWRGSAWTTMCTAESAKKSLDAVKPSGTHSVQPATHASPRAVREALRKETILQEESAAEDVGSSNGSVAIPAQLARVVTLRGGRNSVSRRGIFGSKSKIQTVHCISYVSNPETGEATAVLGAADGSLLKLGGRRVADVVAEAHAKAVATLFTVTTGPNKGCLLSGGKDGVVKLWDNEVSSALAEFDLAKLD